MSDTSVLWRDKISGDVTGPWRELLPPERRWRRAVWGPNKRQRKLIQDLTPALLSQLSADPRRKACFLGLPYLVLLHWVLAQPRALHTTARQFIIVESSEFENDSSFEPLFISLWHPLEANDRSSSSIMDGPALPIPPNRLKWFSSLECGEHALTRPLQYLLLPIRGCELHCGTPYFITHGVGVPWSFPNQCEPGPGSDLAVEQKH
jgi:hypothetical protein